MLFNSFDFVLFLAASCVFYMTFIPAYILILAVTVDYFAGVWIEDHPEKLRRYLLLSVDTVRRAPRFGIWAGRQA